MPFKAQLTIAGTFLATFLVRLLPHIPNLTPLGGSSLLYGAKLSRPWNYLLPVVTLLITDVFLGFHRTMIFVYGSFLLTVWLGERGLKKNSGTGRVVSLALLSSAIFFVVTNFGVWQVSGLYPHTSAGLTACYVAAIPFWRNAVIGDLVFSVTFFKLYELLATKPVEGRVLSNDRQVVTVLK